MIRELTGKELDERRLLQNQNIAELTRTAWTRFGQEQKVIVDDLIGLVNIHSRARKPGEHRNFVV